jgi:hypothetical protein
LKFALMKELKIWILAKKGGWSWPWPNFFSRSEVTDHIPAGPVPLRLIVCEFWVQKRKSFKGNNSLRVHRTQKTKGAVALANQGLLTYQFSCLWSKQFFRNSTYKDFSKKVE